jgi:hypothetical protein
VSTAPNPEGEGDAHVRPKGVGAPKDLTKWRATLEDEPLA